MRRRLTYANIVSTIALLAALGGGTAYALTVTSSNIKDHTIQLRDLRLSTAQWLASSTTNTNTCAIAAATYAPCTATCSLGDATGGGYHWLSQNDAATNGNTVTESAPVGSPPHAWRVTAVNYDDIMDSITVYVLCGFV